MKRVEFVLLNDWTDIFLIDEEGRKEHIYGSHDISVDCIVELLGRFDIEASQVYFDVSDDEDELCPWLKAHNSEYPGVGQPC